MLLSVLSKFLATLLTTMLASLMLIVVLSQTVLNSHYIEGKLAAANSYQRLSVALTDQVSKKITGSENQQVTAMLGTILTPQALQAKINGALDQTQAYYRGSGPQPVIDLTDLAAQAQSAGIPIPEDSSITKPISLPASEPVKNYSQIFDGMRLAVIIGILVLMAALLAISWRLHRWTILPNVLIAVGVLLGLLAAVFALGSGMAMHYIKLDTNGNAFALLGRDLASAIVTDLAKRLGIIALVFGVVGVAVRILAGRIAPNISAKSVAKPDLA